MSTNSPNMSTPMSVMQPPTYPILAHLKQVFTLKLSSEIPLRRFRGSGIFGNILSLFLRGQICTCEAKANPEKEEEEGKPVTYLLKQTKTAVTKLADTRRTRTATTQMRVKALVSASAKGQIINGAISIN